MKRYCRKQKRDRLLLCKDRILIGTETAEYRLAAYEGGETYVFSLCYQKERKEIDVGNDLGRAVSFYRWMVKGKVTPCTVLDILEDLSD